jgi:hypothetical protein
MNQTHTRITYIVEHAQHDALEVKESQQLMTAESGSMHVGVRNKPCSYHAPCCQFVKGTGNQTAFSPFD